MENPYEELLIQRLKDYLKRENISQVELAKRLEWRTTDLNDIIKGRRALGKNRQLHIANKLGISLKIQKEHTSHLDNDSIEIAEMAQELTKEQKKALKTIIHGLAKEKSEAA